MHAATGKQRNEHRIGFGAFIASNEQPVLASDSLASEVELGGVVVKRQAAIGEEPMEPFALIQ